jgi:hypothetical protein
MNPSLNPNTLFSPLFTDYYDLHTQRIEELVLLQNPTINLLATLMNLRVDV